MSVLTDGVGTQDFLVKQNTSLVFTAGERECYADIRIFATGGGGGPGRSNSANAGGGGSGYLIQHSVGMLSNNTDALVVAVGEGGGFGGIGGSSKVEMGGHVLVEAAGGKAGTIDYDGGDGYSGGGGGGRGHGGMDGRDGEGGEDGAGPGSSSGGHGSGQDLEKMVMDHFVLTAGRGGNTAVAGGEGGGGGGGVLVNGAGPDLGLGVG